MYHRGAGFLRMICLLTPPPPSRQQVVSYSRISVFLCVAGPAYTRRECLAHYNAFNTLCNYHTKI
jgi:hypothetical protein